MAERVLEKLDVLETQAKIILDKRAEKNRLQNEEGGKTSVTPLTFDFRLEFEEIIATSPSKTASKITADKSRQTKKSKKLISLKYEPETRESDFEKSNLRPHTVPSNIKNQEKPKIEENLKSRSITPFHYLKDSTKAENSQHRQGRRGSLTSLVFSPVFSSQPDVYKKEKDSTSSTVQPENKTSKSLASTGHLEVSGDKRRKPPPQVNGSSTGEDQPATKDQLRQSCSARKNSLLPLCFEDELKNPNTKIIHVTPAKSAASQQVQNDGNPIIFHDTQYVQTFLLTKNSFSARILENEKVYPCKRTNFVLERNYAILKSLINDESITLSKPQKTMPTAGRKDVQASSYKMGHKTVKNKLKKKTKNQTLQNKSWCTLHNFSQTFSSLTKKSVNYLETTATQEGRASAVQSGRMFSTVKPRSSQKSGPLPLKSYSKAFKNVPSIRKLNNVTPLDNVLNLTKEN